MKIPNNKDFITLPIYSDYSFHKLYPQTFFLFAIFCCCCSYCKYYNLIYTLYYCFSRKQAVWIINIVLGENMLSNVIIGDFWDIHQHMSHLTDSLPLPSMTAIDAFRESFVARELIAWMIQLMWISPGFCRKLICADLSLKCIDKNKATHMLTTPCPSYLYLQTGKFWCSLFRYKSKGTMLKRRLNLSNNKNKCSLIFFPKISRSKSILSALVEIYLKIIKYK